MNNKGQALIQVAVFFLAFSLLMAGFCSFTKWMAVRLKLLVAAKQGALMYSSGHMKRAEVEQRMRQFLVSGFPALSSQGVFVSVHPMAGWVNRFNELDECVAEYRRPGGWHTLLGVRTILSEKCVVKHAPHYWAPIQPWGGPGVPYGS